MTDLLIKRFIKNYKRTGDSMVREQYLRLSAAVTIICDIISFVIKVAVGLFTGCVAITADACVNILEIVSILLKGIRHKFAPKGNVSKAKKRKLGRINYLVTFIIAFIGVEIGFSFFREAFTTVFKAKEFNGSIFASIIILLVIPIKLYLTSFELKVGRSIKSEVILKSAKRSKRELVFTMLSMAAMYISCYLNVNVDSLIGLVSSIMVMAAAFVLVADVVKPMVKENTDPELIRSIKTGIADYAGIIGIHDLIVRNYGEGRIVASVYCEVPAEDGVEESRAKLDEIERELSKKLGISLIIHMDLIETNDIASLKARMTLEKIISNIDDRVSFSDFHMLRGEMVKNLIFDLKVPFDYDAEAKRELEEKIERRIREVDPVYICIISMEQRRK